MELYVLSKMVLHLQECCSLLLLLLGCSWRRRGHFFSGYFANEALHACTSSRSFLSLHKVMKNGRVCYEIWTTTRTATTRQAQRDGTNIQTKYYDEFDYVTSNLPLSHRSTHRAKSLTNVTRVIVRSQHRIPFPKQIRIFSSDSDHPIKRDTTRPVC